jgi:hypothetical protein
MVTIAIIGAGQLGSRHLQSLSKLEYPAIIYVVDPQLPSLQLAKERYLEISSDNLDMHQIELLTDMEQLPKQLDVVIVATISTVRRTVVEQLVKRCTIQYLILEKFLFTRFDDFDLISELLVTYGIKAFVNCPRRMWPFYKEMNTLFDHSQRVHYRVSASNIGIGCNAVHFLDHLAYITDDYQFILDHENLDEGYIDSKRSGFIEFTGNLKGISERLHTFQITSYSSENAPVFISIDSATVRCCIDESKGVAMIARANNNWVWEQHQFETIYQSNLSHVAISQLIESGNCELTNYEDSSKLHKAILSSLYAHLRKSQDNEVSECLVT